MRTPRHLLGVNSSSQAARPFDLVREERGWGVAYPHSTTSRVHAATAGRADGGDPRCFRRPLRYPRVSGERSVRPASADRACGSCSLARGSLPGSGHWLHGSPLLISRFSLSLAFVVPGTSVNSLWEATAPGGLVRL